MQFDTVQSLLGEGMYHRAFPGYCAIIGTKNGAVFTSYGGMRQIFPEEEPMTADTRFDLASLSKVVGTTMAALRAIDQGKLSLYDTLSDFFPACYGREDVPVIALMTHTSGIAAYLPLYTMQITRDEAADAILRSEPVCKCGEQTVYSCMGYILLGKILEQVYDMPLDQLVKQEVFDPLGMKYASYCPNDYLPFAATELDPITNRYICGEVHDENARFLNGVSGNAGIFATMDDMKAFAQMLANGGKGYLSNRVFELALSDFTPHCTESRGLGFYLYTPGKPYPGGELFSPGSFGHTGFTGTSLFVDRKTGFYGLLLTNRVHYGRENQKIHAFRRRFYNAVCSAMEGSK